MSTQATTTNTCNGWTNYETWAVNLWMGGEQGSQDAWDDRAIDCWQAAESDGSLTRLEVATIAFADAIKETHEESIPELEPSVFANLLDGALESVNWQEVARNWFDRLNRDGRLAV